MTNRNEKRKEGESGEKGRERKIKSWDRREDNILVIYKESDVSIDMPFTHGNECKLHILRLFSPVFGVVLQSSDFY